MQRQRGAGLVAVTWQHVEDARRHARFQRDVGQAQRRQRRFFGRFQYHAVAGREGGRDLPGGHNHRVVPRHDGGDDAYRFARDQGQAVGGGRGDFIVDFIDRLAIPAQAVGRGAHVHALAVFDWFAHVQGFQQGQFGTVFLHQVGELDQHALALRRRFACPAAVVEGGAGGLHGHIHVCAIAAGHLPQQAPIDGRQIVESLAGRGPHSFAIDEGASVDRERCGPCMPAGVFRHGRLLQGENASLLLSRA